jgi:hypothetical protein
VSARLYRRAMKTIAISTRARRRTDTARMAFDPA